MFGKHAKGFSLLVLLVAAPLACESQGQKSDVSAKEPSLVRPATSTQRLSFEQEKPVLVQTETPGPVSPGEAVEIRFHFTPKEKIKVPLYPPAYLDNAEILGDFTLPEGRVFAREFAEQEKDEAAYKYYEETPPPIRLGIRIPEGASPGSYPFRGEVHYFFCYEAGGVCAKEMAQVDGAIEVVVQGSMKKP